MDELKKALSERILVLDGAMGTMLQKHGLSGDSETFNFSHPQIIREIHKAYIEAGADIIETNSFGANRLVQAEYGLGDKAEAMAFEAAKTARSAADSAGRKVWVAGSIGPTGKSLSLARNLDDPAFRPYSFDDMADAYEEQIRGLVEGGVDILLFETCFDALNTKAGLYALSRIPGAEDIPVMISMSANDKSGRSLTGQTAEAFFRSIRHAPLLSFGLNCSLGASDLAPLIADVSSWADCPVSCYPNAGLPNEMGQYDESPEDMAKAIRKMALDGTVNIVGGCCGTTPQHISAIAKAVEGLKPRAVPSRDNHLSVSGLESVTIDRERNNFTNIGERTNVAGSRKFARLIAAGDYETALQVAADQIEGGATVIDINMDDAMLDSTAEMTKFLRYTAGDPAVAKAAIMIDSSHWETILAGLKNAQGKCIVNSISLKEGEGKFLEEALEIKKLGAAVVVMAFDEEGQATTFERKVEVSRRAYSILTEKAGFSPSDIILDVNILSVGTGIAEHSRYGIDFIEAVRWIKSNLPGALTSGGVSNLSFAFRGNNPVREAMHSAFLYHAINAGLDMAIVNPSMLKVYDDIEPKLLELVEDVILDRREDSTGRLSAYASAAAPAEGKGNGPVTEKKALTLQEMIVKGDSSTLEESVLKSLETLGSAVDVIEGPLMEGMAKVGELFGAGKMFLPQVVKSARTMKSAVDVLQPYMGKEDSGRKTDRKRIVIATVKGDVHDIGKNITAIVLGCNGFDVTDLGVMVPKENILDEAVARGADLVCASGLITPSLYQMEELCREMSSRGMDIPLLIGGATTSALHTAVKLAPLYPHVFYGADASASAVLASRLMSDRQTTEDEEHEKQRKLRELHAESRKDKPSVRATAYPADSYLKGKIFSDIPARELSIAEVLPFFDWKLFYAIWGIKEGGQSEEQTIKLSEEAIACIERLKKEKGCRIMLSARFDAAHSEGEDIVSESWRLPMLRQEGAEGRSLADFVTSESGGSPAGMFAISVHKTGHPEGCTCGQCRSEYGPLLERSIRLTLAEAASMWLDAELEKQLPKGSKARIIKPAAGYSSCPDHTLKRDILRLLPGAEELNIRLTESCAMIPDASICGLVFAHPSAFYPDIRRISETAVDDYASRRGLSDSEKEMFLGNLR